MFWITGLSGSGKTTLGRELSSRIREEGRPTVFLDGDALRQAIAEDLGHSHADRRRSAMRNARTCRMLAAQGFDVVWATISLFHSVQRWNRANIPNYFEIYLRVSFEELTRRDSKGIYSQALGSAASNVVGLDIPMEEPETPDLVLENYGETDPFRAVETVWRRIVAPPRNPRARGVRSAQFGTKAETLALLAPLLRSGRVLPQLPRLCAEVERQTGARISKSRLSVLLREKGGFAGAGLGTR